MTDQDPIAALGGTEKARDRIEAIRGGAVFRDAGRAKNAVCDLALRALDADDGRALLRHLREWVLDEIDPADRQQCVVDKIDSLLAAEPAQTAEPAAPRRCGHRSPGECSIACHTPDVRGLHEKFTVRRTDGRDAPGQKHHGCDYFVLDLNHDEGAPAAIRAYASAVEQTRPQLASDLRSKFGIATLPPAGAAPAGDDESRIAADAEARIAFIEHAPALLDAAEERDRLRASLDVSRYVERTDAFLARAHAAEAQRDALLAAAEDIAMNAVPNFDVYEMAPEMMMRLEAAIAAAKEAT